MYKMVSFRYESVIEKFLRGFSAQNFFGPPQSQIRSYGLDHYYTFMVSLLSLLKYKTSNIKNYQSESDPWSQCYINLRIQLYNSNCVFNPQFKLQQTGKLVFIFSISVISTFYLR